MADSNVLMPPDYIQRLLARWRPNSGIVCSPPIGSRPESFAAEIECAFLNTYEARWQYAAEAVGFGFAQGKTMLWRRDILEAGGGIEALGAEIAEDAASTKLIHSARFRRPSRQRAVPAAARRAKAEGRLGAAIALGAAAQGDFSVPFRAGDHHHEPGDDRRRRLSRRRSSG